MTGEIKDTEGNVIKDGDTISFAYGIPPVGVRAKVVLENGKLIVLTPGHKPEKISLCGLKRHVGYFFKENL